MTRDFHCTFLRACNVMQARRGAVSAWGQCYRVGMDSEDVQSWGQMAVCWGHLRSAAIFRKSALLLCPFVPVSCLSSLHTAGVALRQYQVCVTATFTIIKQYTHVHHTHNP